MEDEAVEVWTIQWQRVIDLILTEILRPASLGWLDVVSVGRAV